MGNAFGKCKVCRREFPLLSSGLVLSHSDDVDHNLCPGSQTSPTGAHRPMSARTEVKVIGAAVEAALRGTPKPKPKRDRYGEVADAIADVAWDFTGDEFAVLREAAQLLGERAQRPPGDGQLRLGAADNSA